VVIRITTLLFYLYLCFFGLCLEKRPVRRFHVVSRRFTSGGLHLDIFDTRVILIGRIIDLFSYWLEVLDTRIHFGGQFSPPPQISPDHLSFFFHNTHFQAT